MAGLLVAAGAATGALAGFAGGVAWLAAFGAGGPSTAAAAAVLGAAVTADLAYSRWGRPRPLAVGRQVPRVWARLFSPPAVAVLYGARLGVGPLTILPTWIWWASFALAAATGPAVAALAGATFGLVRGVAMVAVAEWLRRDAAPRMARLRRWEPRAAALVAPAALALLALA